MNTIYLRRLPSGARLAPAPSVPGPCGHLLRHSATQTVTLQSKL